mgnify:CR=1 FL=1
MMMTAFVAWAYASPINAQWNVARFEPARDLVYTNFGLDPAVNSTVGYGRAMRAGGLLVMPYIEASVAWGSLDLRDFRARAGAQGALFRWRDLRATANLAFVTRGTSNSNFNAWGIGADAGGTIGLYRKGWFAGGEFGYDKSILTRMTHTKEYRDHHYADAKDGWYLDNGAIKRLGLVGGVSVGRTELVLRAGIPRSQGGESLTAPAYVTFGLGIAY